jgi:glycerophosphoryl diester phosphodiesterase
VIRETPLRYVWIDIKYKGSLQPVRNLQVTYLQLAQSLGRNVEITIGIPDEEVFNNFKQLNNYQSIPAVSELSVEKTREINARIWAPQWTLGLQNEAVQGMQQEGRRAFTWTMDIPVNIRQYMQDGRFDGILSNYPSVVAYYYYGQD